MHVGESVSQKNIVSGLTRVLEMDKVLYHANAWSDDRKSMFILSKQRTSNTRDEKTRNKTDAGEKPLLAEYLVMVQVMVRPTTQESHGHTLGHITNIMRSYCAACKAGCGMCYHRAGLLWMQHLHWGEGRPTPKPATSSFCSWVPGSRGPRNCSTLLPAGNLMIENLPTSNAEAKQKLERGRKYNLKEGLDARYDIFGGDEKKMERLNNPEYTSISRIQHLFSCLRAAQSKSLVTDEMDDVQ